MSKRKPCTVILKKDVRNLGHYGDIVNVARGYAKYLTTETKALYATKETIERTNREKSEHLAQRNQILENANKAKELLDGSIITISKPAASSGVLYGSINIRDIEEMLKPHALAKGCDLSQFSTEIMLKDHIKSTGDYKIEIFLCPQISFKLSLIVNKDTKYRYAE